MPDATVPTQSVEACDALNYTRRPRRRHVSRTRRGTWRPLPQASLRSSLPSRPYRTRSVDCTLCQAYRHVATNRSARAHPKKACALDHTMPTRFSTWPTRSQAHAARRDTRNVQPRSATTSASSSEKPCVARPSRLIPKWRHIALTRSHIWPAPQPSQRIRIESKRNVATDQRARCWRPCQHRVARLYTRPLHMHHLCEPNSTRNLQDAARCVAMLPVRMRSSPLPTRGLAR